MRFAHWPANWREIVVEPARNNGAVDWMEAWLSNGSVDQEDLLVYLRIFPKSATVGRWQSRRGMGEKAPQREGVRRKED